MPLYTDQTVLNTSPETVQLERQRKLAEALTSQAFNQPQGQMISGRYVAPAWSQMLAPVVSGAIGAYAGNQLDKQQQELAAALRQQKAASMTKFQELMANPETRSQAMKFAAGDQFLQPLVNEMMKPQKLGEGENLVIPTMSGSPINLGSGGEKLTAEERQYKLAQNQGFKGGFLDYQLALKRAGATNLSVNTGQHGFDNALKLRENFKSEPIYKGFTEVESANNQIKQAAAMKSPAGDLAAATKVMKILDPGSVVRESELGMAMQATGVEDRVRNYAQMVINGTKLTPSQRADFVALSEKLTNAAGNLYNAKRAEYEQIAEANGLNVAASVPPAAKLTKPATPPSNVRSLADQILQGK